MVSLYFAYNWIAEGDPNLVIPLHDKSKDGSGKPQPMILRNRMPGYDTMVPTVGYFD